MAGKSLNLDTDVLAWVENTARAEGKSQSELVNEILRTCIDTEKSSKGRKRRPA